MSKLITYSLVGVAIGVIGALTLIVIRKKAHEASDARHDRNTVILSANIQRMNERVDEIDARLKAHDEALKRGFTEPDLTTMTEDELKLDTERLLRESGEVLRRFRLRRTILNNMTDQLHTSRLTNS